MNRRHFIATAATGLAATGIALAGTRPAVAFFHNKASGKVFTGLTPGVAIHGYDPVAYFTEGKPVLGSAAHSHEWNGVTWHFASAEHRDAFAAKPARPDRGHRLPLVVPGAERVCVEVDERLEPRPLIGLERVRAEQQPAGDHQRCGQ